MSMKIVLTISISILIESINCYFLAATSNYPRPKLERNNIVNKRVWVRNKDHDAVFEKSNIGNFIFRPDSMDAGLLQNNDAFGDNALQETPYFSGYVQRSRRSPDLIRKRRPRKSMREKKIIKDSVMIKSKIVSDLKPTSVFNEYPYEVAIMLDNQKKMKQAAHEIANEVKSSKLNSSSAENDSKDMKVIPLNVTNTIKPIESPKRTKKYNHNTEELINYSVNKNCNETDSLEIAHNLERNSLDDRIWHQNAPLPDSNIYKVITKEPEKVSKAVSERGLIKVISMLTRTFKKIMKHHVEIKSIHDKLTNLTQEFEKKLGNVILKFEDFDSKYSDMVQFNNKLKEFEGKMMSAEEFFNKKYKDVQDTLTEFQNQQKKFLVQQRQFYGIQKLMLAQNEKINAKQNLIAKTQSEISHRQNNFALILKKTKQVLVASKQNTPTDDKLEAKYDNSVLPVTIPTPTTQSMKINLFAIPTKSKLENQDDMIMKEKDAKPIDDLVYKYYFNNTFIDSLMRSKILNNYASNFHSVEVVRNTKNKRDELETTIMVPISNNDNNSVRNRRWINNFGKRYRKFHGHRDYRDSEDREPSEITVAVETVDAKRNDPFVTMAKSFCKQIGHNSNDQALKWCVEKAIRRLNFMEMMTYTPPPMVTVMQEQKPQKIVEISKVNNRRNERHGDELTKLSEVLPNSLISQTLAPMSTQNAFVTTLYPVSTKLPTQGIFFPDNDELESNLKEFDIQPDTEGNVYFDGSLHISDFGRLLQPDSEDTSDIMPGLMDSNSKVEIDPMAFDLQAKRRAYVRRINEDILKKKSGIA